METETERSEGQKENWKEGREGGRETQERQA